MSDDRLRDLIRLIPPARSLKQDLEKSLHLETWPGTGDMAVRMFQGLHQSVAALTDNAYVQSLELAAPTEAGDKEKVAMATLAASQLLAYLVGETGLAGDSGGGGHTEIQTAPKITIGGPLTTTPRLMDRMLGGEGDAGDDDSEEEEDAQDDG